MKHIVQVLALTLSLGCTEGVIVQASPSADAGVVQPIALLVVTNVGGEELTKSKVLLNPSGDSAVVKLGLQDGRNVAINIGAIRRNGEIELNGQIDTVRRAVSLDATQPLQPDGSITLAGEGALSDLTATLSVVGTKTVLDGAGSSCGAKATNSGAKSALQTSECQCQCASDTSCCVCSSLCNLCCGGNTCKIEG